MGVRRTKSSYAPIGEVVGCVGRWAVNWRCGELQRGHDARLAEIHETVGSVIPAVVPTINTLCFMPLGNCPAGILNTQAQRAGRSLFKHPPNAPAFNMFSRV